MGIVIGLVLVTAVILLGGGNTLKGLGTDMSRTGKAMEQTFNGRDAEPSDYNRPAPAQPVPQLPKRQPDVYAPDSTQHTIPAVQEDEVK